MSEMKPEVKFDDFLKLDIRIGTVVKAEVPPWSHWVMKLTVDISQGDPSTPLQQAQGRSGQQSKTIVVFAGIMKFYKPEDMEGKQFPFVVNLKPKRIGQPNTEGVYEYSQGMMVAASVPSESGDPEDEKPVLLHLMEKVPNGSVVR
jgi:tRNA-binding EMAP/Myf-like protein